MTKTYMIERLGHLGDGIAEGPIFATRCLPGEEVSGTLDNDRISDIRIVTPSAHRIKAPCPHYNVCGGCALLHASDEFVANWKTDVVKSALKAHGLTPEFRPIATSPAQSRRRAVLSAKRAKKGAIIGFHGRKSQSITPIEKCQLLHPKIMDSLDNLAELANIGASRKGEISINVVYSESGLDVSVTGGKALDRRLETDLGQALHKFGFARLAWDHEVIATQTSPVQKFGSVAVTPPSGAFLQATKEGEEALLSSVIEVVGEAKKVIDLFAGCGTFALPLARTAETHAVESEGAMLDALSLGWRHSTGLRKVTTKTRDLFRNPLMAEDLDIYDAAVIDPPRAGALAQVEQLAASNIKRIALVSCNSVTFARDAKTLVEAGYELQWVQVVDQFRWSAHIEQIGCFIKP